jgi:hypothetical protein
MERMTPLSIGVWPPAPHTWRCFRTWSRRACSSTAILDEAGTMVGSMIVAEFPSRADLESQWLSHEPYVVGDVWRKVEILRAQVPPCLTAGRGR